MRLGSKRCSGCGAIIAGRYYHVWTAACCARCAATDPERCAGCGEYVFTPDPNGGRVGSDRRHWFGVCGIGLVGVDVASGTSIRRVQATLRDIGVRIGISGLKVDLVPVTRADADIGHGVLGVAHSRYDGRTWDHHIKVQRFLPKHRFGGTLTHEILHAWLARIGADPALTIEQQEGICELFAHLWMRGYGVGEALHRWVTVANRRDDEYGHGYRWAVARYGLRHAGAIQDRIRREIAS